MFYTSNARGATTNIKLAQHNQLLDWPMYNLGRFLNQSNVWSRQNLWAHTDPNLDIPQVSFTWGRW